MTFRKHSSLVPGLSWMVTLVAGACKHEDPVPPQIVIDLSPVNVGIHEVGASYAFDLQLSNRGDDVLEISDFMESGDANCAFLWEGPDRTELGPEESAFLRGTYVPSGPAVDQVALLVHSNADNFPELVVPVCGRAVPVGTPDAEQPVCEVPPESQADCIGDGG